MALAAALSVSFVLSSAHVAAAPHDARAVELFQQSADRYREGRFREAADLLREAYAREPEPLLLFNLGRACEGMGDAPCAIDAYTRFLAAKTPSDRGAIESRVATLKRQVDEKARLERSAAQASAPREAPAPAPARAPSVIPWIVAGVGAAGLGVTVGLGSAALDKHQQAIDDQVQKSRLEKQADAKSLASTTNAVLIVSALVTSGGVAWGVVDLVNRRKNAPSTSARAAQSVTVAITPGSVSLVGRF